MTVSKDKNESQKHILVINTGSSSVKLSLFTCKASPDTAMCTSSWNSNVALQTNSSTDPDPGTVQKTIKQIITDTLHEAEARKAIPNLNSIDAVGHRIVHGGTALTAPSLITHQVMDAIRSLSVLAPLHNPLNLAGVEAATVLMPKAKQVAVYDTAFFATLSEIASTYPGPYEWKNEGIKRYGFHGISHEYNSRRCAELLKSGRSPLRIVSCHLGNGASLAAIRNGTAVDTTMGFTPLDGLMMGSRPGSLDPGILTFLMQQKKIGAETLSRQLNYESGLKGISGNSADMRTIIDACSKGDKRAQLAYGMFIHSLAKNIAAMGASLGGVDAVVFSGGIGENSAQVRRDAVQPLGWMGIAIDDNANGSCRPDASIAPKDAGINILVIMSQEDQIIADACRKLLN